MRHDAIRPFDRVVLAHGFTQTARSWRGFERLLDERLPGVETVAVDMPGHGDADTPADSDLEASADRLVEIGGPAVYVGYSMGGRVALHAALRRPGPVRALVLIGATAGIDDDAQRRERRVADERLADHIEDVGMEVFIDEWLQNPLFSGLDERTADKVDRLRNTPTGLAASLRAAGTGTQTPLWERLGEIRCPVLVLVGADDAKFSSLGRRLVAALPDATMRTIADAGHTVHLEQPVATADAITTWIAQHRPDTLGV